MNPQVTRALRGIAAVVILTVLVLVVVRWWREYKAAPEPASTAVESTSASPNADKEGSGTAKKDSTAEQPTDVVVVLIDGLNLRVKPEADAKAVRGLNKDERLTLVKTQGAWYLVKTAEGDEGWVSSNPSYSKVVKR